MVPREVIDAVAQALARRRGVGKQSARRQRARAAGNKNARDDRIGGEDGVDVVGGVHIGRHDNFPGGTHTPLEE